MIATRPRILTAVLIVSSCLLMGLAPAPAPAPASPGAGETPRPEDGYFQEPVLVADGVWALVQPKFQVQPIGNVTVIEQGDGLVLVDTGGSPGAGRRIVAMVKAISQKPVKAVIITHWHGDHPQGLSEILKAWPKARTIATRATQAHLRDPATMNTPAAPDPDANAAFQKRIGEFIAYVRREEAAAKTDAERAGWQAGERLLHQYALDMDGALTLAPAESYDARLVIRDRERPVEALFLGRANTDGDAVVWLPRQKVLVAGDIVVAPFPYGQTSYPGEWLTVLDKLRAYDFAVLIPGHGQPQRDKAYIGKLSAALMEVREKVGAHAAQGLSLQDVQARADLAAQKDLFVPDDPWARRWFDDFWSRPIVTSAYREAKGEPIIQSLR